MPIEHGRFRGSGHFADTVNGSLLALHYQSERCIFLVVIGGIALQKSKIAGLRIFVKNSTREAIADSYSPNRVTEVPCKFNVQR